MHRSFKVFLLPRRVGLAYSDLWSEDLPRTDLGVRRSSSRPVTRIVAMEKAAKKEKKKRPQVGHTCSYNATAVAVAVALAADTATVFARQGPLLSQSTE